MMLRKPTVSRKAERTLGGFTLMELVVVLAVLAVLAAIILSAVAAGKERSTRTQCLNNLKQIGAVSSSYAHDNNDLFYPPKHASTNDSDGFVPNALADVPDATITRLGLRRTADVASIWTCPNRPGLPLFEESLAGGNGRSTR